MQKLPFVAYFLSRLLLINVNEAEFTDGYQLLTWSFHNPVRWHPLYPLLLKPLIWWLDPPVAGRLVSIFSGFVAMVVLIRLARMVYGQQAGAMMAWLYVVSPLFFWINLRVLTESTFQFLICLSLYWLLVYWKEERPMAAPAFIFFSGLACLTRPEGYLFLPVVGYVLFQQIRATRAAIMPVLAAFVPWCLCLLWSLLKGTSDSYSDVMVTNLADFQWRPAFTRLISYIEIYPYIMFYPLLVFALFNLFRSPHDKKWSGLLLYFHLIFGLILVVHLSWTTRLLLIPISFLLVEASAGLSNRRRSVQVTVLICCFLFSIVAIFLQRGMFSDFKHSALAVKGSFSNAPVISDEQAKTVYYLGRSVIVYKRQDLNAGDILILHSYNTDLREEKEYLDARYRYRSLFSSQTAIVPLLGNAALAKNEYSNSPMAFIQRFQRQHFQSVVLTIDGKQSSAGVRACIE